MLICLLLWKLKPVNNKLEGIFLKLVGMAVIKLITLVFWWCLSSRKEWGHQSRSDILFQSNDKNHF